MFKRGRHGHLTLRQLWERYAGTRGSCSLVGTQAEVTSLF